MAEAFTTPGALGLYMEQIGLRDRRIAELEAALKNFYAGHQGCSDPERDDCQCRDCLAYRAYKVGNTPILDAAIAAAKREALDRCIAIARGCEDYGGGYCDGKELDIYHHGMQTVQRCLIQLREGDDSYQFRTVERIGGRMAREVKP